MPTQSCEQADKLKSLVEDLEQRVYNLKHFDAAFEVNSHCDDLIGQVTLTIESAMEHLNKVQTRMINEINDYRNELHVRKARAVQESVKKLSHEIEAFKSSDTWASAETAFEKVNEMKERANQLRKQTRANAFDNRFMRLIENDPLDDGIIGSLVVAHKDVQEDFAIKHTALDDSLTPFLTLEPLPRSFEVAAVCYLRDGRFAIGSMGSGNSLVIIWDPVANKKLFELHPGEDGECTVTALAQLQNGRLACADNLGQVTVVDLETKKRMKKMQCGLEPILWLKVLSNGYLAVCSAQIYIWDLTEKNEDHVEPVAKFGIDVRAIFREYHTWEDRAREYHTWEDRAPLRSYLSKNMQYWAADEEWGEDPDFNLEFSFEVLSNGQVAFSYLRPEGVEITLWDPDNSRRVRTVELVVDDIESCTLLPAGDAVICRKGGLVEFYSLDDGRMHHSFRNDKGPILAIRQQSKHSLQFVHINDADRAKCLGYKVSSTCFSNDGKYFAAGSNSSKLAIWQLQP